MSVWTRGEKNELERSVVDLKSGTETRHVYNDHHALVNLDQAGLRDLRS